MEDLEHFSVTCVECADERQRNGMYENDVEVLGVDRSTDEVEIECKCRHCGASFILRRPKMRTPIQEDMKKLADQCREYLEMLENEGGEDRGDAEYYVFEVAMEVFYGPDVWKNYINRLLA